MSKRRKHAKALVMQPVFRPRQEAAKKGKGSYRRDQKTRSQSDWSGFSLLEALLNPSHRR